MEAQQADGSEPLFVINSSTCSRRVRGVFERRRGIMSSRFSFRQVARIGCLFFLCEFVVETRRLPNQHVEKRIDSRGMFRGGKSVVESIL